MEKEAMNSAMEMPLWLQLNKVSQRYVSALASRLGHLGIDRYFFLLVVIGKGKGKLSQQALADILEVDKVSMVGIMDYLVHRGFVTRAISKRDRREREINLTAKGMRSLPEISKGISDLNRIALSALPAGLAEKFSESLGLVKSKLSQAEQTFKVSYPRKKRTARKSKAGGS